MLSTDRFEAISTIKRLYRSGHTKLTAIADFENGRGKIYFRSATRFGTRSRIVFRTLNPGQSCEPWVVELNSMIAEHTPEVKAPSQVEANRILVSSRDRYLPQLRKMLSYHAETGVFTWLIQPTARMKVGDVAGCKVGRSGNLQIQINGWRYMAHELAWAFHYGAFATSRVHHRDGNSNAITNLYVGKK